MKRQPSRPSSASNFAPLIDGLLVGLAGWVAYYTRWSKWDMPLGYLSVLILGTGLVLVLFPVTGTYRSWRGEAHWRDTGNALPGLFAVTVLLMITGTLTKSTADFSRLWMGYWFIFAITALFAFRWLAAAIHRRLSGGQLPTYKVLLVGDAPFAYSVAERAGKASDANWDVVGLVSPNAEFHEFESPSSSNASAQGGDSTIQTLPRVSLEQMDAMISKPAPAIDEIWITMDNSAIDRQRRVIDFLQASCITVRYVPDLSMLALLNHIPSEIAGMMVIDLNASPLTGSSSLIKTALDMVIALAALVTLSPLLMLIAILIKQDSPGPVFFRQERHGWDGEVIKVLKFRTMRENGGGADGSIQTQRGDPRVTRIGGILRRASLDELPQFINVLKGEMSIVGPRPHPVALNEKYIRRIDAYMQRHRVKPGITGWAQIHGLRGETESLEKMQRRIEFDLYYIEHWSLWLDVRIIARTLVGGWTNTNAY